MAIGGKGRPTKAQAAASKLVNTWLAHISTYDREFKKWESRVDKILKRYRDEDRSLTNDSAAKFNILWANVQTLVPVTYSKVPQPDVSRRFKDNDPVGRVAGLMLERALDFEVQHYEDYRGAMKACVLDRFLGGRGTAWARYEPHIRAVVGSPEDGVQVTEDADEPREELDYECAPVDYVHWKDFGHTIARSWDEVTGVWRKVYMTKQALEARFGEEKAKTIPLDSKPEDTGKKEMSGEGENLYRACIYEIWDKETGKAYWLSKSKKEMVDEKDDPLGLEDFFPCPKPLYASLTNETLIPVPDFVLYQDQARNLDTLADRREGLIQALQVKGVYDASVPEIARIFTEGVNGTLIPVKNWAAFAEKNGLEGALDVIDLKNIYEALAATDEAIQGELKVIYDITGLADIVRGQSEASETATAQQIKGRYASLRLNGMKEDVAGLATRLFQLKAQIMCGKFSVETFVKIAGVDQLSEADREFVGPALELLFGPRATNPEATEQPNPLRIFRIEVNSDTMVQIDEEAEKQSRMEFLSANGVFMDKATQMMAQAGPAAPILGPVIMSLWKYGVTGFKVGRLVEGEIDQAADKLKQLLANPPPQRPDPEMAKVQAEAQLNHVKLQQDAQAAEQQAQRDFALEQARMQAEQQNAIRMKEIETAAKVQEKQIESQDNARQEQFDRWKVQQDNDTKIIVAQIAADAAVEGKAAAAEAKPAGDGVGAAKPAVKRKGPFSEAIDKLTEIAAQQMEAQHAALQTHAKGMEQMTRMMGAPRKAVRDPVTGRVTGSVLDMGQRH